MAETTSITISDQEQEALLDWCGLEYFYEDGNPGEDAERAKTGETVLGSLGAGRIDVTPELRECLSVAVAVSRESIEAGEVGTASIVSLPEAINRLLAYDRLCVRAGAPHEIGEISRVMALPRHIEDAIGANPHDEILSDGEADELLREHAARGGTFADLIHSDAGSSGDDSAASVRD